MPGNAGTLSEKNVYNIDCDINNQEAVLRFAIDNKIDKEYKNYSQESYKVGWFYY